MEKQSRGKIKIHRDMIVAKILAINGKFVKNN